MHRLPLPEGRLLSIPDLYQGLFLGCCVRSGSSSLCSIHETTSTSYYRCCMTQAISQLHLWGRRPMKSLWAKRPKINDDGVWTSQIFLDINQNCQLNVLFCQMIAVSHESPQKITFSIVSHPHAWKCDLLNQPCLSYHEQVIKNSISQYKVKCLRGHLWG